MAGQDRNEPVSPLDPMHQAQGMREGIRESAKECGIFRKKLGFREQKTMEGN